MYYFSQSFLSRTPDRWQVAEIVVSAELRTSGRAKIRTSVKKPENMDHLDQGGAESGALGARDVNLAPDLAEVVELWPTLPEAIRASILAMVRSTK
jgi:hypothetical protein